jgi:dipeptidyl aminopeptidase/acylaminoacyl peptidase
VVEPVSDAVFEVFRGQFSYDPTELDARVESTKDNYEDWVQEKITFDAAYGGERMIAHLFLPRNTTPPYQTVVYFPGSGSVFHESSDDIETYFEFPVFLSFILKSGRAVLYPVFKGTFERRDLALAQVHQGGSSHLYAEYVAQLVKDFSRSVDYLESREEIDSDKLAYYGMSWGAMFGAIVPAVEGRLKASVLLSGGVVTNFQNGEVASYRPEADPLNYLPRVKVPTLMINGRYDTLLPFEHSIQPMFDLLGTPAEHKQLRVFDTDHIPPRTEFIRETLAWFDRYLGPVTAPRTGEDGG